MNGQVSSEPAVVRRCRFPPKNRFVAPAALVAAVLASTLFASAREPGDMIEWPFVGSEQAQTKYSTAGDITAVNVGELEIVAYSGGNRSPIPVQGDH